MTITNHLYENNLPLFLNIESDSYDAILPVIHHHMNSTNSWPLSLHNMTLIIHVTPLNLIFPNPHLFSVIIFLFLIRYYLVEHILWVYWRFLSGYLSTTSRYSHIFDFNLCWFFDILIFEVYFRHFILLFTRV